ncbi:MAG: triphosphoribosyl-dephospho-CoA synthase [Zestosphaera sp.]
MSELRGVFQDTLFKTRVNVVIDIFSTSILLEALAPFKLSTVSGYKSVKDLNIIHFVYTPNVLRPSLEETARDAITSKDLRLGSYLLKYVESASTHPLLKTNTAFGYLMLASPLLYVVIKALVCGDSIAAVDKVVTKYHQVIIDGLKKETHKDFYLALKKASISHLGEYFGRIPSVNVETDSALKNFSLWDVLKDSMYLDVVSHEIVTGFKRVLGVHESLLEEKPTLSTLLGSVTAMHTKVLSSNLDTLVLKSKNLNSALLLKHLSVLRASIGEEVWERIDNYVRENELNPGSTSDIVAAGLALYQVSTYVTQNTERSTT